MYECARLLTQIKRGVPVINVIRSQILTKTIARTYHFEKTKGVDVTKVEIKPLKLPDNLSRDKGTKLVEASSAA